MDKVWTALRFGLIALAAWWAGVHGVYKLLLMLQVLDVASGVVAATRESSLASTIGKAGIRRKAYIWLILFALQMIQVELGNVLNIPELFEGYGPAEIVGAAFAFMEFVSIIENSERLGIKLPSWVRQGLAIAREKFGYGESEVQ